MKIDVIKNDDELTLIPDGRLDTMTAPEFEKVLMDQISGVKKLYIDFEKTPYLSSAGIRVLLKAAKMMLEQGSMKLLHVPQEVMEVLDITGFLDIFDIN